MKSFSYDIAKAFADEEFANWKRGYENKLRFNSLFCSSEVETIYSHLRYICEEYLYGCYTDNIYTVIGSHPCARRLNELARVANLVSFEQIDVTPIAKLAELDLRRGIWKLCELPAWADVRSAFLLSEKAWKLFQTVYGNATNWYREGLPTNANKCRQIIEDYRKMSGEEYVELMLMGVPIEDIIGQPQQYHLRLDYFPSAV